MREGEAQWISITFFAAADSIARFDVRHSVAFFHGNTPTEGFVSTGLVDSASLRGIVASPGNRCFGASHSHCRCSGSCGNEIPNVPRHYCRTAIVLPGLKKVINNRIGQKKATPNKNWLSNVYPAVMDADGSRELQDKERART